MIKEACVESYEQAKIASINGANRIELCENLAVGGTTPSYGTIKMSVENLRIPIFVMIRARGGNFIYDDEELEIMKNDILMCKQLKVAGVVFGILTKDNKIDLEKMKILCDLAKPMQITFHKAIDEVENPLEWIDNLTSLGVTRILTSGKQEKAIDGVNLINEMIKKSQSNIKILVAGKVTKENLKTLSELIDTDEFHGRQIV